MKNVWDYAISSFVKVVGAEPIDIQLSEDVQLLDELVVSGLASTVKRENLANSVTTIDARN
ncbi:hypothetical protein [Rhodohalobacter sp.]|uniref:hypothetical protein n=1 Tax=Rhodohalobacter sp. TaxID=1974210 RepID=UPI002ACD4EEA|nr:hypothetical protein [Rhodohalobacter sp.]MDZ7756372.1 hypothetical protein [Rhodohalobacter sp.]